MSQLDQAKYRYDSSDLTLSENCIAMSFKKQKTAHLFNCGLSGSNIKLRVSAVKSPKLMIRVIDGSTGKPVEYKLKIKADKKKKVYTITGSKSSKKGKNKRGMSSKMRHQRLK